MWDRGGDRMLLLWMLVMLRRRNDVRRRAHGRRAVRLQSSGKQRFLFVIEGLCTVEIEEIDLFVGQ